MSRLCRLKSYSTIGDDGLWAYAEIKQLRARVAELEAVIKSHGIPVKTYAGGEAHYCWGPEPDLTKCPMCGGEADNGFDRGYPPNPYFCKKCMENEK